VKKAMGVSSSNLFSTIAESGWKNFNKQKGLPLALTSAGSGFAAGAAGGAVVGGINALRAPNGERMRTFSRDIKRGAFGGLGAGAILGGGVKYVTKPLNSIANLERDIDALVQTRERAGSAYRAYQSKNQPSTMPAGASGVSPESAAADPQGVAP
jgi:hypothetical protein